MSDIKQVRDDLQEAVGESPEIEVDTFKNWAETQVIKPVLACKPKTVEEVQAVIKGAKQLGLQVRAAGRTHSWTPLFADQGQVIMYVRELQRPDGHPQIELTQDEDDPEKKLITMATGVTTGEFKDSQLSLGVCIPANVILRVVQMGGVVVPACHGVGWDVQTVSDYIVSMRIVDSDGVLRTYSMKEDPDMMRAVGCNLGLWGILVDFTLKVDPMWIVETENRWIKVKDLFYNIETMRELITTNWSVEIFWFPFNGISQWEALEAFFDKDIDTGEWDPKEDEVWVRVINRPDKVGEVRDDKEYKQTDFKEYVQAFGFDLVDGFIRKFPQAAPSFLRTQVKTLKDQFDENFTQQLPHAVHFRGSIEDVPVLDMEWAFSLDEDCTNLMPAIQDVVELVHKEAKEGRFPMNLPLEMRFIADSQIYMAPAICGNKEADGGSGHTCYIEVLAVAGTPDFNDFSIKVAEIWKKLKGARPHWCKDWSQIPGIDDFIRKAYSKQIPKFIKALERSKADPTGMFFNSRLEGLFYPKGHPGRKKSGPKKQKGDKPQKSSTCVLL